MRTLIVCCHFALAAMTALLGCASSETSYGVENRLELPAARQQVWAIAPAVNLSGQAGVDPLIQADLLFAELQSVRGIQAIPVNRVAMVYAALRIGGIETPADAQAVCEALGADALVVPTVTLFDPYNPPQMGAALQVFAASGTMLEAGHVPNAAEVMQLTRTAREAGDTLRLPTPAEASDQFLQQAGVFDSRHGSVRKAATAYAQGRTDPTGATSEREVFLVMDRYAGFVYHALLAGVMDEIAQRRALTEAR